MMAVRIQILNIWIAPDSTNSFSVLSDAVTMEPNNMVIKTTDLYIVIISGIFMVILLSAFLIKISIKHQTYSYR